MVRPSKNRFKSKINKALSNKKKLFDEAAKCKFFVAFDENLDDQSKLEAFSKLYKGLGLTFTNATKGEKRAINNRFRTALIQLRAEVSF